MNLRLEYCKQLSIPRRFSLFFQDFSPLRFREDSGSWCGHIICATTLGAEGIRRDCHGHISNLCRNDASKSTSGGMVLCRCLCFARKLVKILWFGCGQRSFGTHSCRGCSQHTMWQAPSRIWTRTERRWEDSMISCMLHLWNAFVFLLYIQGITY